MAKLQYGPIVTSASGKVAGVVFSIWKGVQYVKRWVKPTYTNTAAQILIRDAFAALCQLWKYLPSSVVLAWTNYAKGKGIANRNAWIGSNVKNYAAATIGVGTPHNPAYFPPVSLTVSNATAIELRGHIVWPSGYTTNDVARMMCIRKSAKEWVYNGSAIFPATQIAVAVGIATVHWCHAYLCPTLNHERSMSLNVSKAAT
jgi:hypothetical protein